MLYEYIHNYSNLSVFDKFAGCFWRPYWIYTIRKRSKWTNIYSIIFLMVENVGTEAKFMSLALIIWKLLWYLWFGGVVAAILDFKKCHRMKFYTPSKNYHIGPSWTHINQQKKCILHFHLEWWFLLTNCAKSLLEFLLAQRRVTDIQLMESFSTT